MKITRRDFARYSLTGVALALAVAQGGCVFGDVYTQIQNYVNLGLRAFAQIVKLLGLTIPPPVALAITAVQAAFAGITAAVAEYQNAPAADKSTLAGKIAIAIQVAADQLGTFLAALTVSDPLITLIAGLVKIIVSTLLGFLPKLPGAPLVFPAATPRNLRLRNGRIVAVGPIYRSPKQFKQDFNSALAAGGHAELELR